MEQRTERHFQLLRRGWKRGVSLALAAVLAGSALHLPMGAAAADLPKAAAAEEAAASVRQEQGRKQYSLNNDWRFHKGNVPGADQQAFDDSQWLYVNVPHSTVLYTPEYYYQKDLGVFWYRHAFQTPAEVTEGSRALLTFEGAMQKAEVWLNGTKLGTHKGGYTPFSYDVTEQLKKDGSENLVAVKLDTRPGADFAPGKNNPDFQYFGGLYRGVSLTVTDPVHVTDAVHSGTTAGGGVFLTAPAVSADAATVKAKTEVHNESGAAVSVTVQTQLLEHDGTAAASAESTETVAAGQKHSFVQTMQVQSPRLWSTDTPELYTVRTTISKDGAVCDTLETTYGIRKVEWKRDGCYINDKRVELLGTNLHQETYMLGNAMSDDAIYEEVKRLKEYGFNFIRMAHYPHGQAFYDACDKYGVAVLDCLAGWQNFNGSQAFRENTYEQMRDMVRENRNHPSIVAWEPSLNESHFDRQWAVKLQKLTKEEYPDDGVSKAYTCGWKYWDVFDMLAGTPQANVVTDGNGTDKPVIVSEYGDWNMGGFDSSTRITREPTHIAGAQGGDAAMLVQCDNIQSSLAYNRRQSWYGAAAYWQYADYAGFDVNKLTYCGVVDVARIPKFSAYFYQSQRDPSVDLRAYGLDSGPMAFIANSWAADSPAEVRVFSNCEEVELYLDDQLIARQTPDKTMWDPRGAYPDTNGGAYPNGESGREVSTEDLAHPPFTFDLSAHTPGQGTLKAVGYIGGQKKAEFVRSAPGTASKIVLRPENDSALKLDGSTAKLVWVDVTDADGTVVNTADHAVAFETQGPGFVIGAKQVAVRGGQWAVWVRSQRGSGDITLTASAEGLEQAAVTIPTEQVAGLPAVPEGGDADETLFQPVPDQNDSIAFQKPAKAVDGSDSNAANAVDGDPETQWSRGGNGPGWWQVDLEKTYHVEEVSIFFKWAWSTESDVPVRHSFVLQSSEDGVVWKDVQTWSDMSQTDNEKNELVTLKVDADARFLRVKDLRAKLNNNGADQWIEIGEFTARGTEAVQSEHRLDYGVKPTATSNADGVTPSFGNDGNPSTFWVPAREDEAPSWQFDAEGLYDTKKIVLTWNGDGPHFYRVEQSADGTDWTAVADHMTDGVEGAVTTDTLTGTARYVRISLKSGGTDGFWVNCTGLEKKPAVKVTAVETLADRAGETGTTLEALKLPREVLVTLDGGLKTRLTVAWDADSFRPDSTAVQTVRGTLTTLPGIGNPDGLRAQVKVRLKDTVFGENLFLGKPATASSENNGANGLEPAVHGNDGNESTKWCAAVTDTGDSTLSGRYWWQVDLEDRYDVEQIKIVFDMAGNYQYQVAVSDDPAFTDYRVQDHETMTEQDQIAVVPVHAAGRYVRIYLNCPSPVIWPCLREVYGTGQAAAEDQDVEQVRTLIGQIGQVTLEKEGQINEAKAAYDALTPEQQAQVGDEAKAVLDAAIGRLEALKAAEQAEKDRAAAKAVEDRINAIGKVTLASKNDIKAARSAYDALTDAQKKLVSNLPVLEAAEAELKRLEDAQRPVEPDRPHGPDIFVKPGKPEAKPVLPFTDVTKNDWFYGSVYSAWENDLLDGMTAVEFAPNGTLTVAQTVKLAAALHQREKLGRVTLSNGAEQWYSTYVDYAIANGILETAYAQRTPAQMNKAVSRREFVKILHGAMAVDTGKNKVADNAIPDVKLTDKHGQEIYDFYRAGILTGSDEKGTFYPETSIKRSEAAAILVRMYDTAARESITLNG